LSCQDLVQRDV